MNLNRKLCSAVVGILAATVAWGDGASDGNASFPGSPRPGAPAYLALGDSVPFGFNPLLKLPVQPSLFVGYPLLLGVIIDEPVVNAACPGQTSSGFLSLQGTDNGCFAFREVNALHVQYSGTQLEFAEQFVASHPHTQLVTIQLGANDLFLLEKSCNGDVNCVAQQAGPIIKQVAQNVGTAIAALRQAGYDGQIIVVLYYSSETDPTFRQFTQALNQGLAAAAAAAGVQTADTFAAFDAFSGPSHDACAAGLLIVLPTGGCDVHPSAAGAELIAETIAPVVAPRPGEMRSEVASAHMP